MVFGWVSGGETALHLTEEGSMTWLLIAVALWTSISAVAAVFIGAATRTAERRERQVRVPTYVPQGWSLTSSP
jgi:hypothetical protein